MPQHGTPYLMAEDQFHNSIHTRVKAYLMEQVGLQNEVTKRPKHKKENDDVVDDVCMVMMMMYYGTDEYARRQSCIMYFRC